MIESVPRKGVAAAVFASGRGSNFINLYKLFQNGALPELDLRLLICDKECGASAFAEAEGFPYRVLKPRNYESKSRYEEDILTSLQSAGIELIILAGYMRLIGPTLLRPYAGHILNLHPSLLPDYPGTEAIARAFRDRRTFSGVTVHLVDEGLDSGPILAQERVELESRMSLEDFESAIHACEHRLYPETIRHFIQERGML